MSSQEKSPGVQFLNQMGLQRVAADRNIIGRDEFGFSLSCTRCDSEIVCERFVEEEHCSDTGKLYYSRYHRNCALVEKVVLHWPNPTLSPHRFDKHNQRRQAVLAVRGGNG